MINKLERVLVELAESTNETVNKAMELFHTSYGKTYKQCAKHNLLTCKKKDCCINKKAEIQEENDVI
jgi:hypothetical protein